MSFSAKLINDFSVRLQTHATLTSLFHRHRDADGRMEKTARHPGQYYRLSIHATAVYRIKIAEIDVHGGVNPVNGLVAPALGTVGGSGALLAARRAAEIVRSVGGEIRVGGQVLDSQTLDMRARLKIAYGA